MIWNKGGGIITIKKKKEIVTNMCGKDFDIQKLKNILDEYDDWLMGNHLGDKPFMNVRMDFLRDFKQTIDGEVPFYYHDGAHFIRESHGIEKLFCVFFRFVLGAEEWKKSMKDYHSKEFKKYKESLSYKDVYGMIGNENNVRKFKKRMKKL